MKLNNKKMLDVNELADILAKEYGVTDVMIDEIEHASCSNQGHPKTQEIGWGGVLTVHFTTGDKVQRRRNVRKR